jgi:hypothetical protein
MSSLWPWIAVAGAGALHGLNPCTGWMLAATCGVRARDGRQALRALVPIAAGHVASLGLVVAMVVGTGTLATGPLQLASGALLVAVAGLRLSHRAATARRWRVPAGRLGLALWSCMVATAHGTGLMLLPALVPLCVGAPSLRAITSSGSWPLALAAVGVHVATMLAVTAAVALGACRGVDRMLSWRGHRTHHRGEA